MNNLQENKAFSPPYEWSMPKAYSVWISNIGLTGWKGKFFRTIIITAILEIFFYFLFNLLPVEELGLNLSAVLITLFLITVILCFFIYFEVPYSVRFGRKSYTINEKGVFVNSSSPTFWKYIIRCDPIEKQDQFSDVICLAYYTKRFPDRPRHLAFEKTEEYLAERVHEYIQSKITVNEPVIANILTTKKLSRKQHVFLVIFSILWALLFSILMTSRQLSPPFTMMGTIILGPGTLGILLVCRKDLLKYQIWPSLMFIYNFLVLSLIVLISMAIMVFYFASILSQDGPY